MHIPLNPRKTSLGLALLVALFVCVLAVPQEIGVPSSGTYTVQAGDNLEELAKKFSTTVDKLKSLNGLKNPRQLKTGQVLRVPLSHRVYTVRAGDTLVEIARSFGVTAESLIKYNDLKTPHDIAVGQDLKIPGGPAGASPHISSAATQPSAARPSIAASAPASLQATLLAQLNQIRIVVSKWKYIVIHHSASIKGSTEGMDAYHRNDRHMENGLAYHFVIGNGQGMPDGQVDIGGRWRRQIKGGHLASPALNEISIGICLVGDFERSRPTAAQLRSLRGLLTWLMQQTRVDKANIKTHTQINTRPTACPGRGFPTREVANWQYPRS